MKKTIPFLLIALLLVCSAYAACGNVKNFTPSCTGGTITKDVMTGCRTITCTSGGSSMQVQACDKPDSAGAQYFELYKQTTVGTAVTKVCLGATCVSTSNFAKSAVYTCNPTNTTKPPNTTAPNTTNTTKPPNTTNTSACGNVQAFTPSCTGGSIVQDLMTGCRTIKCVSGSSSMQAMACDKPSYTGAQFFELYKQSVVGTAVTKICLGSTCVGADNFAKSALYSCTTKPPNTTNTTKPPNTTQPNTSKYPLKTNIVVTQFWVGQPPSEDTGWSNNFDSAWDVWWMEHYGGFDDPNHRNGWYPAGFTPKENPFYVAIPYTDFGDAGRKSNAFTVVPWAKEKTWGFQESMIKNRWIRIIKGSKTVYAQVENSGPGPTDDWQYVFGSNPQPTTGFGWKAGIDVSPAVRDYLTLGPVDNVSWQWVTAAEVPAGPWKNIVTTRQSCWDSVACP